MPKKLLLNPENGSGDGQGDEADTSHWPYPVIGEDGIPADDDTTDGGHRGYDDFGQ